MLTVHKMLQASVISLLFGFTFSAAAAEIKSTTSYSADRSIETTSGGIMHGKVYHTPDKERSEQEISGQIQTMIMRKDKGVMWILIPAQRMYLEQPLNMEQHQDPANMPVLEMTEEGKETINGMKTTKYKVRMQGENDTEFDGYMWHTAEGIMVKMDATSGDDKRKERVKIELTNIDISEQEPTLFEIPKGYSTLGGLQDMMKNLAR